MIRGLSQLTVIPVFVAALLFSGSAGAYEVEPVENGGTITGRVILKTGVTTPDNLEVTKDKGVCGLHVPNETLIVKDGMVQHVVISIEGITAGKSPIDSSYSLTNLGCRFVPHVQTMLVGAELSIENDDPLLHTTHATYEGGRTAFNVALPLQNQKVKRRIRKPGVIRLKCDSGHTWMGAYILAFRHPYHTVTGESGSFSIPDIPPGTYTLSVWHEQLAPTTVEVTVEAGRIQSIEIELRDGE